MHKDEKNQNNYKDETLDLSTCLTKEALYYARALREQAAEHILCVDTQKTNRKDFDIGKWLDQC